MTAGGSDTTVVASRGRTGWFVAMLALTLMTAPFTLIGPLVALATPLRSSRRQMTILWVVACILVALMWALALWASSDHWPSWLMFDEEEYASA